MRGAFGETDFDKKVIRINKRMHAKAKKSSTFGFSPKESTLINTIVHEMLHKNHPNMTEKRVRELTKTRLIRMNPSQKKTLYSKFA